MPPQQTNQSSNPSSGWQPVDDNSGWTPVEDEKLPPSVLSEAGKHPIAAKVLKAIPSIAATVGGIAGSETGPLAVGTAAGFGAAGKALENTLEEKFGFAPRQASAGNEAANIGVEGLKQGAYEFGGRAIGAAGGRALTKLRGIKPEVVGETIGGVKLPETMGQATGKPAGLSQTVEHYLSKTFMGGPLQGVKAAQQQGAREILANLSHASEATPGALAGNWERATQETRILGDKLYGSLAEVEAPTVGPAAKKILDDESLRLPGKAKNALTKALGEQTPAIKQADTLANQVAKQFGYKSWRDPGFVGQMDRMLPKDTVKALYSLQGGKVGDAIAARSELRDLATHATDRNLGRLYKDAWEQLDHAINASLTPGQRAVKYEADKVWRRSYIQEKIAKNLTRMQNVQAPTASPSIATDSFVKMVNELAHVPITREGGQVATKPSNLDILFDNPADRKAMVDLANFLKTKYSTMGGQAGISESIARIGVALEALSIPGALALGHPVAAATGAAHLASMYAMAHVMANPGGAALLSTYFRSSGAAATALAARIAGQAIDQPEGPAPRSVIPTTLPTTQPAPNKHPSDAYADGH